MKIQHVGKHSGRVVSTPVSKQQSLGFNPANWPFCVKLAIVKVNHIIYFNILRGHRRTTHCTIGYRYSRTQEKENPVTHF